MRTSLRSLLVATSVAVLTVCALPAGAVVPTISPAVALQSKVATAAIPATGSYTFTTSSSSRTVVWNTTDMTYTAKSGGGVFGWAQFEGRRYERVTRPNAKKTAAVWYDRGPGSNASLVTAAKLYPRDLGIAVVRGARTVSGRNQLWTVTGNISLEGVQAASTTTTIRFATDGRILSITNGKLRLTMGSGAPVPLIKSSEITSELD